MVWNSQCMVCLWVAVFLTVASATFAHPGTANCTEHWFVQTIDHFAWDNGTYLQRYYVYDKWFKPGGPMLFYTGNEANLELFVNNTGWMWSNGEELGALLVFAEHRFFGESRVCPGGYQECGNVLSSYQAMADFASLIRYLTTGKSNAQQLTPTAAYVAQVHGVIALGGSYGGMLAAWMRMLYPALVDGAVASSAPIACISPQYNTSSYWAVVTRDATPAGGALEGCDTEIHKALEMMRTIVADGSDAEREKLASTLGLCNPKELSSEDLVDIGQWGQSAFDLMAMGNYPFPTAYIAGTPEHPAPAWPMKQACKIMMDSNSSSSSSSSPLLRLREAMNVVLNTSGAVPCHDIKKNITQSWLTWDYMVCTEAAIHEQPFFAAVGLPNDMFWKQKVYLWDPYVMDQYCSKRFGKTPRFGPMNAMLGPAAVQASSNIVFANGLLDPWHSGGILRNNTERDLVALIIPDGGHHLDLFFPNSADPESVKWVRRSQVALVKKWLGKK